MVRWSSKCHWKALPDRSLWLFLPQFCNHCFEKSGPMLTAKKLKNDVFERHQVIFWQAEFLTNRRNSPCHKEPRCWSPWCLPDVFPQFQKRRHLEFCENTWNHDENNPKVSSRHLLNFEGMMITKVPLGVSTRDLNVFFYFRWLVQKIWTNIHGGKSQKWLFLKPAGCRILYFYLGWCPRDWQRPKLQQKKFVFIVSPPSIWKWLYCSLATLARLYGSSEKRFPVENQ